MKFFTKDWATGELTDEAFDAAPTLYAAYISTLDLPPDVLALDRTDLHDGILQHVETAGNIVLMELVTGDLQQGYFTTVVTYVAPNPSVAADALRRFVGADVELLYTEVDRTRSDFVHRLLFSTHEHVEIPFESAIVRQSPRSQREAAP